MRRDWLRGALLALGLGLGAGLWGLLYWVGPREAPASPPSLATGSHEEPGEPAPPPPPPVEAPAALAITGRVVDAALEPAPGIVLAIGSEEASTAADGTFSFPAALRPRAAEVALRGGGENAPPLAVWQDVLTGDRVPAADGTLAAEPPDLPPRLGRVRWTFTLGGPRAGMAPGAPAASLPPLAGDEWLRIDAVLAEEWGSSARIRLQGRSRLPDGSELGSSLYFDRFRTIASIESAKVAGGAFTGTMYSPEGMRLYSAAYEVQATFHKVLQPAAPEPTGEHLQDADAKMRVAIGSPDEAREDDRRVQAYYREVLAALRARESELRERLNDLDLQKRAWKGPRRLTLLLAAEGRFQTEFMGPEGQFLEERWRRFLDEEWRPAVQALLDRHEARTGEKYHEAEEQMLRALGALRSLSYVVSGFVVYPTFGLKTHPKDFYPDEDEWADGLRLETILAQAKRELERFENLVE